ncbi:MAG: uracil phosphoribosyltransferase, partial [Alphaproteobacteria bacterium]
MSLKVTVVDHPLVQHKLTLMRSVDTPSAQFRQLVREISLLLGFDALKDLELTTKTIQTPLAQMDAPVLKGKKPAFISILRAGNGLLEGFLDLVPSARVGHVGLYRDPETLEAVQYYLKLPEDIGARKVVVVDPMLATANSSIAAVSRLKEAGANDITFVCVLAAPEGIEA